MSYPEFLIDKRVVERNIKKGIVDSKEHAKVLDRLPDVADNAEACRAEVAAREPADDDTDEG